MISFQDLVTTPEYWTTKIQLDLYNMIKHYIDTNGLTQVDLAKKMGVSKGYVSQILNGDFDHRISKFVELSLVAGMVPQISYIPMDKMFAKETSSQITIAGIGEKGPNVSIQKNSFVDTESPKFSKVDEGVVYNQSPLLLKAA
jgi:transcriptional regulator with XRE-family HTH domain